jgi:uncharacterized protein
MTLSAAPSFCQFVIKIFSRCNLSCDYCYVYEAVDKNWLNQPKSIGRRTVQTAGRRIAEHAAKHCLTNVSITLHGGEPLMVGLGRLSEIVDDLRSATAGTTRLDIGLQTNGVLLDRSFAEYFFDEQIRIGISLDGGRSANDRHRRYAHGGSSYDQVVDAVRLMMSAEFRPTFSGILATIDPTNDPVETFRELAALGPMKTDLLLPHATWETPPPAAVAGRTIYGDWLVEFFDAWYDSPPVIGVRLFEEAMHAVLGGVGISEAVGLTSPGSIVIESDGSYERTDALKIAYPGAPATGHDIFRHSLDDLLEYPAIQDQLRGRAALAVSCQSCPIVTACGGGLYPHRYRAANGFDNPSVYCGDLARLITHIQDRIAADLARRQLASRPDGRCQQQQVPMLPGCLLLRY